MRPECFLHSLRWKGLWLLCCLFLMTPQALADNWQASIYEDAAPSRLVGVDKKQKIFNFYEKKSPLRLRYSYPCVTGQLQGDKQQINDLRTPEGIYFVEYKIANGLDFKEYGGIAYTLNYPNPVDRLRGKTGHGIWIHSKGFELVPTKGCVAINLKNIAEIGPHLLPGTPVVLAEELKNINGADNGELDKLRNLMREWTSAWEGRSARLFDFYDPASYTRATENFALFRSNKERLFKILSFIKIYNREIHALEGPGYWVTWSEQLYTASNLSTEGIRRLYWQKDDKGDFRIVGMEWTPRDMGMKAEARQGRLVAEAPFAPVGDASSEAPVPPPLDMPEKPLSPEEAASAASQKKNKSSQESKAGEPLTADAGGKRNIGDPLLPGPLPKTKLPDEIEWGKGSPLAAREPLTAPGKPPRPVLGQPAAPATAPEAAKPRARTPVSPDEDIRNLENAVLGWVDSYKARNRSVSAYYDQTNYNRMSSLGVPQGPAYNKILQGIQRDFAQPWMEMIARPADLELHGPVAKSRSDILIITPAGMRQGAQTLWWHKDDQGRFRIVGSEFRPQALGLEANYLENISSDISKMVEDWRKAWEAASLDSYLDYYTPDAIQQGRAGQHLIRRQKEELWQRKKPAQVQLSGLRLLMDPRGVRADMNQVYSDSQGVTDRGIKTLYLRYDGGQWKISREDWTNSQASAQAIQPVRLR